MFAGVAIGAGTGAVAGHMAGEGARPLRAPGWLRVVVFAGASPNRPEIGRTLFENGPLPSWICDSTGLEFGAE
jgi:hypothetical protein